MTAFYLGTHEPSWLARAGVPLFVSRGRLARRKSLPRAVAPWALDSGGFSELTLHGRWTVSPAQYVAEVQRWGAEIGSLAWAAVQDWMCEPVVVARTGLSVAEHQARTVQSFLELSRLAPLVPWVPVVQGWSASEYLAHVDQYRAVGVDLARLPLVGIGSVCRRQATVEAEIVVRRLADRGIRLHGFGFKTLGLVRVGDALASADSLSWSFDARRLRRRACVAGAHKNCANCLEYALSWRAGIVRRAQALDARQLALPGWSA